MTIHRPYLIYVNQKYNHGLFHAGRPPCKDEAEIHLLCLIRIEFLNSCKILIKKEDRICRNV